MDIIRLNRSYCRLLFSISFILAGLGGQAVGGGPRSGSPTGFASVPGLGLESGTTGGAGGQVVVVENQEDLERFAAAEGPMVIRVRGTIRVEPFGRGMPVSSNKTIIGIGADAEIVHGGFRIMKQSNVIIRNLTIRDTYLKHDPNGNKNDYDGIQIDNSHHIWIDHCHIARMGDGLIDSRKGADYITVSWCILSDHYKTFGVGWTKSSDWHMTIHNTWFRDTQARNPAFDNGIGHFFNNYLQNVSGYGHNPRGEARVVVENSVFENVNRPFSIDGDSAELVSRGNIFRDSTGGDEPVGTAFDPSKFYDYEPVPAGEVPALLRARAGPQPTIGR
jgi:pectinesterase